jgi:hypothetical protein
MCLRRAPEKYIAGAALDRAELWGSPSPLPNGTRCRCQSVNLIAPLSLMLRLGIHEVIPHSASLHFHVAVLN